MDKTTFRILDILSRNLGSAISINKLTSRIKEMYGTAYYKNIYDEIQELGEKGIIATPKFGKATMLSLNQSNSFAADMLLIMEIKKKENFLKDKPAISEFIERLLEIFDSGSYLTKSISLIRPRGNIKLNRAELFFLMWEPLQIKELRGREWRKESKEESMQRLYKIEDDIIRRLQISEKRFNIKIDPIILTEKELEQLISNEEINPAKYLLADQITLFNPQQYWRKMLGLSRRMQKAGIAEEEFNISKIKEPDIIYNLNRFGYKEFGTEIKEGKAICLEYIIISLMLKKDTRRIEAIPALIAKNEINYLMLLFLAKKYGQENKLLALLKALNKFKKNNETEQAINLFKIIASKEEKVDEKSIKEKMRLYNAI